MKALIFFKDDEIHSGSSVIGGQDKGAWVHTSGLKFNGEMAYQDTFWDTNDNGKLDENIASEKESLTFMIGEK